jgi:hypothetical protein
MSSSCCASGSSSIASTRSLRARSRTRPLFDFRRGRVPPLRRSCAAGDRGKAQLVGTVRKLDDDDPRPEQLAQASGDELEQPAEIGLGRERVADLVQRLEPHRPAARRLVEPRVLHRLGPRLAQQPLDREAGDRADRGEDDRRPPARGRVLRRADDDQGMISAAVIAARPISSNVRLAEKASQITGSRKSPPYPEEPPPSLARSGS